jgi:hypothetical protein
MQNHRSGNSAPDIEDPFANFERHSEPVQGPSHPDQTPIYKKMFSPWITAHDNSVRPRPNKKDSREVGISISPKNLSQQLQR